MDRTDDRAAATGDIDRYLRPTNFVDSGHPAIVAYARSIAGLMPTAKAKAVALYYGVRDGIRYDPYNIDVSDAEMKASRCLERGYGFCVSKAALLAAAARAQDIPARLGFADVINHLSSERLRQSMKTDIFAYHGYVELYLGDRWVKATPSFNLTLCQKVNILPLDFDGARDSVFHPFDASGRKHMEYVRDHGVHADIPLAELVATWQALYGWSPGTFQELGRTAKFEDEAKV